MAAYVTDARQDLGGWFQCLERDRQPGQAHAHKAHPYSPMGIDLATQTVQGDGNPLQAADQVCDGDAQQQAIDPPGIGQCAVLQLEDSRLLVAKELLAAEALAVKPERIQIGVDR